MNTETGRQTRYAAVHPIHKDILEKQIADHADAFTEQWGHCTDCGIKMPLSELLWLTRVFETVPVCKGCEQKRINERNRMANYLGRQF